MRVKDSILLTGATGALGSILLQRLCGQGYNVICLVRANDSGEARARIRAIVGEPENLKVIRGDVGQPRCGISDIDREILVGRVRRVLHSAASVNFQDRKEAHLTNVSGTLHVLELTDILDASHMLHISTAYVVGDAPYLGEQDLSLGQRFRNSYEESKFVAEKMVRAWALKRDDRRFTIFRPSILVGCEDGTTSTFDGFYRYCEPLHYAVRTLRNRAGQPLPPDVEVHADGSVSVPLAMHLADIRVNYIPIDWVADMIVAAIEAPTRNDTYHLVHNEPPRISDVTAWSFRHLGLKGIKVCRTRKEKEAAVKAQSPLVRRLQRRLDIVHDVYAPYCTTEPQFEIEAAPRYLGRKFRWPPIIDERFLERTIRFATQNEWGAIKPKLVAPIIADAEVV
jgi:thioester reductase-like protein